MVSDGVGSGAGVDQLKTRIGKTYMYDAVARAFTDLGVQCSSGLDLFISSDGGGQAPAGAAGGGAGDPPEGLDVVRVAAGAALLEQT